MAENTPERYLRFPLWRRIEHWTMAISFTVLALTGLPQKYGDAPISDAAIRAMGGIEMVRVIHRISAVILALVAVWHIGYALWHWFVQRKPATMMLNTADATNAWETLKYNLGRAKERPRQGYYTFEEKIEYWALIWGTLVMVVTGFFLWNPITAARVLPGEWIPAAKAAHGGEALLAVLAIIIWHLYHVLVRTFNRSMFTGYLTREQMEHEHPLALEEPPPINLEKTKLEKRKRQFWIGYGIVATAWLVGLVWFVTSESTATDVIQPVNDIEAYTPLEADPLPQREVDPAAAARYGTTWEGGVREVFEAQCAQCHRTSGGEGGLDLSSYAGALAGGESGPAVVPGAPGISPVMLWPLFEDHPGRFSPLETDAVWGWIAAGAPEQ